jgi:hypothetical protein
MAGPIHDSPPRSDYTSQFPVDVHQGNLGIAGFDSREEPARNSGTVLVDILRPVAVELESADVVALDRDTPERPDPIHSGLKNPFEAPISNDQYALLVADQNAAEK